MAAELDDETCLLDGEVCYLDERPDQGDVGGRKKPKKERVKQERLRVLKELLEAMDAPPPPTPRRINKIVAAIAGEVPEATSGLLAHAELAVAKVYQPGVDWDALMNETRAIMARIQDEIRIEQEIEDEDEFIILMTA